MSQVGKSSTVSGCLLRSSPTVIIHTCMMSAILRLGVLLLWVSYACGILWYPSTRQRSHGHYYYPHGQASGYNYPNYNQHYQTYQKPPCSAETPCYERLISFTSDAIPDTRPNPNGFINHHMRAGLDKYAIIEEGKRAAKFFHHQYGVDVGYLADEAYLTPNITLPSGMRFTYAAYLPTATNGLVNVVTQGPAVHFVNAPASFAEWKLTFPADYYSNGAFKGHIPAGSCSDYGNFFFDTCPDESLYNPCRSPLSRKPKGQVFIKYRSRTFRPPEAVDCILHHEEWGQGHVIGVAVTTTDGVRHERGILTFPGSCDPNKKCFAGRH